MTSALPNYHFLAKPARAACNPRCQYCFFLPNASLYPGESVLLDAATQEAYIRQTVESSAGSGVQISWQGGEPKLAGLALFRRSVQRASSTGNPASVCFIPIK